MPRFILTILFFSFACGPGIASAQISVEITSRRDTLAFVGSCTDTHVLIHNLPSKAVVSIDRGAVVHVRDSEYVLCRFGAATEKYTLAILYIKYKGAIIFSKPYKIIHSEPTGSIYNPILHIDYKNKLRTVPMGRGNASVISAADFKALITEGLTLSDTACKLTALVLTMLYRNSQGLIGPLPVGNPYLVFCGYGDTSERHTPFNTYLNNDLKTIKSGMKIFMENIIAIGPGGGIYEVRSPIITIQ